MAAILWIVQSEKNVKRAVLTNFGNNDIYNPMHIKIAVYFYESCSILASPKGESKYK